MARSSITTKKKARKPSRTPSAHGSQHSVARAKAKTSTAPTRLDTVSPLRADRKSMPQHSLQRGDKVGKSTLQKIVEFVSSSFSSPSKTAVKSRTR